MTRFARTSKKTSLEATPWHELVNSSGDNSSTRKDTSNKVGNETKMAGRKRKKKLNPDDDSIVPKISRKSEDKKIQRVGVEGEANMRTAPKKKYVKKGNKSALNSIQGNGGKMKKNKKHGPKSDMHKSTFIKHKRKLLTDINRTESLDKKHEARRKRRAKGKPCFHCRQTGHLVAECPMAQNGEMGVGNCYKCGSSEHTTKNCTNKATSDANFPFAKCFICGETGHIARACPDNPKGLYPNGGGCKICGSVEHFRRDCPELVQQNKVSVTTTHAQYIKNKDRYYSADAELEDLGGTSCRVPKKKGPLVVKF